MYNFTGEITDLQKELTDCHTKFENLLEQQGHLISIFYLVSSHF